MKLKHFKRIFKILGILLISFILLFVIAVLLLKQPNIQTWASNKVLDKIQQNSDAEASIEKVNIKFPKSLVIDGFYQEDEYGDTLVYAEKLTANISLFKPFKRQIHVQSIKLDGAVVKLNRKVDEDFNFSFLLGDGNKQPNEKSDNQPFDFSITNFELNNSTFELKDEGKIIIHPASIKQLKISLDDIDLVNKSVAIDQFILDQPNFKYELLNQPEKKNITLTELIPDFGWEIKVNKVKLKDGQFKAVQPYLANNSSAFPLDPSNLSFQNIQLEINDVRLDSIAELNIKKISLDGDQNLKVKAIRGKITATDNTVKLKGFQIALNNSRLSAAGAVTINDFNNLVKGSNQNTNISAYITPADANLFLPADKHIQQSIAIQLKSKGSINNLSINHLSILSNELNINASGDISQLTKPKSLSYAIIIEEINASSKTIQEIAPWLTLPEEISSLGNIRGQGSFTGNTENILANFNIDTDAGNVTSNMEVSNGIEGLNYRGELTIPSFNLQDIIPNAPVSQAGGTFTLNGSGNSFETINGSIKGKLFEVELNDYTYKDVYFNGKIADKIFNGSINIDDKNVALDFDGELDLSDSIPSVNSKMEIEHIDLQALNLMDKPFKVALSGDVDFTGNSFDNLNGEFNLASLYLDNDKNQVEFDSTLFTFKSENDYKLYAIISEKLTAHAEGVFNPIEWPNEVKRYLSDYVYYINDTTTTTIQEQQIKGNILLKEGFGLTEFLVGSIRLPDNLEADFEFHNTKNILNVNAHSNAIGYQKYDAKTFDLTVTTKDGELITNIDVDSILANAGKINITTLGVAAISTKEHLNAHLSVEPEEAPNRIELNPEIAFSNDSINIHFAESYFKLNDIKWPFKADNEIILNKEDIIARNFAIYNDNQYLKIVNASSDLSEALIEFNMLELSEFANIVQLDTIIRNGLLTGQILVKDPLKDLTAEVDLNFNSIQVFDLYCDSLSIDAKYNKLDNKIELAAVFDDPNYDLSAVGFYDLNKGVASPANVDVDINKIHLGFLDVILKDEAQFDIYGEGKLQFRGSATKPIMLGEAYVVDTGKVHIKFLGIDMLVYPENGVREKVIFTENTMDFQSMNVRDPFGNRAYMEGKLTHFNFKDISVDAKLITDNFNLLNTTYEQNEDFFGRAFGEGTVNFSGLTRNINMDIDMKTKEYTRLSIPLASAGDTKEYGFKFINPFENNDDVIQLEDIIEIKGVNMNFNLEVTPEAELELVLNTDSENNLKAIGNGLLNLSVDQNKQLSIYGTYNLIDGEYVFSPQNLLNKKFKIDRGSNIIWNGKPFEAAIDVDAKYAVNARVDNILQDSSRASQIVPMDVIIHIGGTLNETDVSFGIVPSRSSINANIDEVESFLDEIKNDEGEITTQAISLMLVNRFLPSNSTVFTGSNFSASEFGKTTALELVSNQVSNYLTDAISKLITEVELSFNIIQRDDYTLEEPGQTTTVQLDYTQKFVNNRLIVNIGGNFEFSDQQSDQDNNIAGDFEVEGLLTEDGRLRGKAFHRTADYDIFNQGRSTTGVSLSYQKDFDTIDEVFKPDAIKQKRRQNKRDSNKLEKEQKRKARKEKKVKIEKT